MIFFKPTNNFFLKYLNDKEFILAINHFVNKELLDNGVTEKKDVSFFY